MRASNVLIFCLPYVHHFTIYQAFPSRPGTFRGNAHDHHACGSLLGVGRGGEVEALWLVIVSGKSGSTAPFLAFV